MLPYGWIAAHPPLPPLTLHLVRKSWLSPGKPGGACVDSCSHLSSSSPSSGECASLCHPSLAAEVGGGSQPTSESILGGITLARWDTCSFTPAACRLNPPGTEGMPVCISLVCLFAHRRWRRVHRKAFALHLPQRPCYLSQMPLV